MKIISSYIIKWLDNQKTNYKFNYKSIIMRKLFFIFFAFFSLIVFSQNTNDAIVTFSGGGMRTMNIKSKPKKTLGSVYYTKKWCTGNIHLLSGEIIKDYELKYDLKTQNIEIKLKNDIKIIAIGSIKKIEWYNSDENTNETFMNCSNYGSNEQVGMYKIISDGKVIFFKKTTLKVIESNYNQALDVGSQSSKYIKENKFYVFENGRVKLIKKRKKNILKLFGKDAEKIKIYAKEKKLNLKKEQDLVKIFNYFDSI